MKRTLIVISLAGILALGCADTGTEVAEDSEATMAEDAGATMTEQAELSPTELGELSAEISRNPENAEQILSDRGLTQEEFEEHVRRTAADPQAASEYAEAFRKRQPQA